MADTTRTVSYLVSSIFQDGQAAGSINEQDLRDFVVSAFPSEVALTPSAGAVTWALATNPQVRMTLTANTTMTITGGEAGKVYRALVIQDATGSRTVTVSGATFVGFGTFSSAPNSVSLVKVYLHNSTLYYDVASLPAGANTLNLVGSSSNPQVAAIGSSTNIGINFVSKGSGALQFNGTSFLTTMSGASNTTFLRGDGTWSTPTTSAVTALQDSNGFNLLQTSATASATNYVTAAAGATGNPFTITANGGDSAVGIKLVTKSTGSIFLATGNGNALEIVDAASAVNRLTIKGSATTAAVTIGSTGTDTDVSINVVPKGSGTLQVGGAKVVSGNQVWTYVIGGPGGVAVSNGTYPMGVPPKSGTVLGAYAYVVGTGTANVAAQISASNITGLSALNATTSSTTQTNASGSNTFSTGNQFQLVVSSSTVTAGSSLVVCLIIS